MKTLFHSKLIKERIATLCYYIFLYNSMLLTRKPTEYIGTGCVYGSMLLMLHISLELKSAKPF